MSRPNSPFKLLTQIYASQIMTREQYIKIRGQLLKKLQKEGEISEEDLKKISNSTNTGVYQKEEKVYSLFDWVIIALGLTAAAVLGLVLYT